MTDSTIGSGGDYPTLALWEAGAPPTLTEVWRGLCLNEEFTGSSTLVTIAGSTSTSSFYKELTTASGAGFADNANASTNALRYNASNGAAITSTASNYTIYVNENYARITGLQIKNTNSIYAVQSLRVSATGCKVQSCIVEYDGPTGSSYPLNCFGSISVSSCLIVQRASGAAKIAGLSNGTSVYNTTFATPGDLTASTDGVSAGYAGPVIKNCAIYGVTNVHDTGGTTPTYTTCYTNVASPPSGCTTASYSTSAGAYFENISDGTHDYRIQSSSSFVDNGTYDATNAPNDIIGTAFGSGTTDVGCWEFAATGSSVALTGQSVSVSQGSLSTSSSVALSGQSATLALGILAPANSVVITGQSITTSIGTLTPVVGAGAALTGQTLSAAQGSLAVSTDIALVGQELGVAVGTLTPVTGNIEALTGQSAVVAQGSLSVSTDISLTGQEAAVSIGVLTPVSGNIEALTGQSTAVAQGSLLASTSVALTGQSVSVSQGSVSIPADSAELIGQSLSVGLGSLSVSTSTSVALTGLQLTINSANPTIVGWVGINTSQTPNWTQITTE